jgi:hypothetical protein
MVVERTRLEEILAELNLQHTSKIDQSTAQRLGKLLGAQYLVTGNITTQKGASRIDAKVIKVESGVVAGAAAQMAKDDIFDAEMKLAEKLNALLAKADARDPPPPPKPKQGKLSMDNALKYSQALDALDKKDKKTAKEKLEAVVKAQPDFLLASLELDRLMK